MRRFDLHEALDWVLAAAILFMVLGACFGCAAQPIRRVDTLSSIVLDHDQLLACAYVAKDRRLVCMEPEELLLLGERQ